MNKFLRIVLISLITVCIFDPADKLLGLKVPLFVLGWLLFLFDIIANRKIVYVSKKLIMYLTLFISIPLLSIAYYFLTGTDFINYDGYRYFKSYLFVTLVLILYISKIDLTKPTVVILSTLSIVSIIFLIISWFDISLVLYFYEKVGLPYGICTMGSRDFGTFLLPRLPMVFFHTGTLIVFPIAFFTMKVFSSKGVGRMRYGLLLAINMVALFFCSTKSCIVFSVITPIFVAYWYSKRKGFILCGIIILLSMLYMNHLDAIKERMEYIFRPEELSNMIKISYFHDYLSLFSDAKVLWFGQGLGSYFNTTIRGYVSLTELTYFELIRSFGLILSLPLFTLILYPLSRLRIKEYRSLHYIFIAYLCYLTMCITNPLLVSSSGMLLLSIVLYKTFSPPSPSYLPQSRVSIKAEITD